MTLNELVLTSLENLESFAIQEKTIDGKYKDVFLNDRLYEKLYKYEVENYYLNVNKNGLPYIVIELKNY